MAYENFKHIDPDGFHDKKLTLHDCRADKILLENGTLRFFLPDGFWVAPNHIANSSEKAVRTDASIVDFSVENIDDIIVLVFSNNKWFWSQKTRVENWHIEQLISAVNCKGCTLEFQTQYRSYYEQMWHCIIHSRKKPYYRECQLYLPKSEGTFYWNNLCLDREW